MCMQGKWCNPLSYSISIILVGHGVKTGGKKHLHFLGGIKMGKEYIRKWVIAEKHTLA